MRRLQQPQELPLVTDNCPSRFSEAVPINGVWTTKDNLKLPTRCQSLFDRPPKVLSRQEIAVQSSSSLLRHSWVPCRLPLPPLSHVCRPRAEILPHKSTSFTEKCLRAAVVKWVACSRVLRRHLGAPSNIGCLDFTDCPDAAHCTATSHACI